jgi:hypothetical protein
LISGATSTTLPGYCLSGRTSGYLDNLLGALLDVGSDVGCDFDDLARVFPDVGTNVGRYLDNCLGTFLGIGPDVRGYLDDGFGGASNIGPDLRSNLDDRPAPDVWSDVGCDFGNRTPLGGGIGRDLGLSFRSYLFVVASHGNLRQKNTF